MRTNFLLYSIIILCFASMANATNPLENAALYQTEKENGFTENKGQITGENGAQLSNVLYAHSEAGMDILITTSGLSYVFWDNPKPRNSTMKRESDQFNSTELFSTLRYNRTDIVLEGAKIEKNNIITSEESIVSKNIYYNASNLKGIKNVRIHKKITFEEIYPGIDWVLYTEEGRQYAFKYDFVIKPGANPSDIKMLYEGAEVSLNSDKTEINITTDLGSIREGSLFSYQLNKSNSVSSSYKLNGNEISFEIDDYNNEKELIIDPPVIVWSTNYGGTAIESFNDMSVDADDNLYFYGKTRSVTLPAIIGNGTNKGYYDAFVVKFDTHGTLLWSAMFGGAENDDTEGGIVINNTGEEIYFCGNTPSTDFPIQYSEGAYNQSVFEGGKSGFISKIDNDGTLLWSTFIGGNGNDYLRDIDIDADNQIYIMGFTSSTDFPIVTLNGAYNQSSNPGGLNDGVLIKLDENDQLVWSTYFGGDDVDQMSAMKISPNNNLVLVGSTRSRDFPLVEKTGAYFSDAFLQGDYVQAVVMEFDESRQLVWSTLFGGLGHDMARTLVWDADGNLYVVGATESPDMPVLELSGAYFSGSLNNEVWPNVTDAFILRFDGNGALDWSTYYGGDQSDLATAIDFDEQGNMWLGGATGSQDFPIKELDGAFNQTTSLPDVRVMF